MGLGPRLIHSQMVDLAVQWLVSEGAGLWSSWRSEGNVGFGIHTSDLITFLSLRLSFYGMRGLMSTPQSHCVYMRTRCAKWLNKCLLPSYSLYFPLQNLSYAVHPSQVLCWWFNHTFHPFSPLHIQYPHTSLATSNLLFASRKWRTRKTLPHDRCWESGSGVPRKWI